MLTLAVSAGCMIRPDISYEEHVYPILVRNCIECHRPPDGSGYLKSGLDLRSYNSLMQGTYYGAVIVPGDSRHSILNMLVEGRAGAALRMPHNRDTPLTDHETEILRRWVDQGARK